MTETAESFHGEDPEWDVVPSRLLLRGQRRIDGEAYLSRGFRFRQRIVDGLEAKPLSEMARVWQPPRLKGVRVSPEYGLPFLGATQVFDIWPVPRKWLTPKHTPHLDERYLKAGWILVTCSGNVGDTLIAYEPVENAIVSHDLLRVVPYNRAYTGFLYTYLRTRYGRAIMRSSHYGNVIKHLEVEHLETVPVPAIDDALVDELYEHIQETFQMRADAYRFDLQARASYEAAVGIDEAKPSEEGFPVPADILFRGRRRFDAYAYNPNALAVLKTLERSGRTLRRVGDVASFLQPPRFKRVYGKGGIPYLSSEETFRINPEITKFLTLATDTDVAALQVEKAWLLMACSGQIYGINGSVCIATEWHEGKIFTHDMIRIIPKDVRAGYLQVALSHPELGRPLVLRNAYGTSIPHLESPDIADIPIPRLAEQAENDIADAAEKASALRMKADKEESGAIAKLEREIEHEIGVDETEPVPKLGPLEMGHKSAT